MNIVLDNIVFSLQRSGGISVVWYELLSRLIKEDKNKIRFLDQCCMSNPYRSLLHIDCEELIAHKEYVPVSRYMPLKLDYESPFIFHSSYYRYCTNPHAINVSTVHDFTYEYYRNGMSKRLHCWQKYKALRHSDAIVCISENTKKDLLHFLPDIDNRKIRVIYNGVSDDYFVNSNAKIPEVPFSSGSYVVFVGSRSGYKNFDLVKRCIAQTQYNFVIVGSDLTEQEKLDVKKYIPDSRLYCAGFLTNQQLNAVYNHAAALIYPSAYEGFGIPVLEAQKAGCPVIAYNSSSIPEIIGTTPLLMNELSEEELVQKMSLLSNKDLVETVVKNGLENAKRFSWDKMFSEYQKLYEDLYNNSNI